MAPRSKRTPAAQPDPHDLKRESAGRHVSGDGRFTVEKGSGGWLVIDAEQSDELGLPLVRGPFDTLEEAKAAVDSVRVAPAPTSALAARVSDHAKSKGTPSSARRTKPAALRRPPEPEPAPPPEPPPVVIREYRSTDGRGLRDLWAEVGFNSIGDDDASLRRFAARNPGLVLVAVQADRIVASALGAWDGRRGWLYHVATARSHRRSGIATRLVRQVEASLRKLGAPRVNVIVRDDNPDGVRFWTSAGYADRSSRQFGRDLDPG
jgi:ribosomal protein S18 acetylase RimI-like enzyme